MRHQFFKGLFLSNTRGANEKHKRSIVDIRDSAAVFYIGKDSHLWEGICQLNDMSRISKLYLLFCTYFVSFILRGKLP